MASIPISSGSAMFPLIFVRFLGGSLGWFISVLLQTAARSEADFNIPAWFWFLVVRANAKTLTSCNPCVLIERLQFQTCLMGIRFVQPLVSVNLPGTPSSPTGPVWSSGLLSVHLHHFILCWVRGAPNLCPLIWGFPP